MAGFHFGEVVMLQLGSFQFGIKTAAYQELSRTASWTWAAQNRFGQLPGLQFTGPAEETISLPGVIYPEFRGGFAQVDDMRALAAAGKPLALVDGTGASLGRWVIETVDEKQTVFASAGRPRKIEFTLSLRRFPDEPAAQPVTGAITEAAGVTVPAAAGGAVEKVRGLAGSAASAAKSLSATLSRAADQVREQVAPYTSMASDALGGVLRSMDVVNEIQTLANRTLATVGISPILPTALNGAQNLAGRAAGLIVSAESASAVLRNSSARLSQMANIPAPANDAMRGAQAAADRTVALARQVAAGAGSIKE